MEPVKSNVILWSQHFDIYFKNVRPYDMTVHNNRILLSFDRWVIGIYMYVFFVYACVCVYVCMCACICVCTWVSFIWEFNTFF